jgi:DNA-binding MarR family transcriptional regulator
MIPQGYDHGVRRAGLDTGDGPAAIADADAPAPANPTPLELAEMAGMERPAFQKAVGFTLSSLGYAVGRRFHRLLAPLELEPREFALLRAVCVAEGQSQQAIGERLQIPASRMVAFVDALERRGLLERRPNPHDRRARELHLTVAGHELLSRAFVLAVELERELCAELSGEEREQLLELLERVGGRVGLEAGTHAAHAALADE